MGAKKENVPPCTMGSLQDGAALDGRGWQGQALVLKPHSYSSLQERDEAGDEQEGGNDVGLGGVIVLHAQFRTQDVRDGHGGAQHCKVVLKVNICLSIVGVKQRWFVG